MKTNEGFWVAPTTVLRTILSEETVARGGWWVVRYWDPIIGPFYDREDAVIAMMTAQNVAS